MYRVVQNKPHIVVIEPDAKVNSQYYCRNVLGYGLLPDIRAICQHHTWTLQQDGAPLHTAKNTMEYLRREYISFIEPDMWPTNSPDLNPVDYAVWGALQQNHRGTVVKLLAQRCRVSKCLQMKTLSLFGESSALATRIEDKMQETRHIICYARININLKGTTIS